jgi:hypothetical protein
VKKIYVQTVVVAWMDKFMNFGVVVEDSLVCGESEIMRSTTNNKEKRKNQIETLFTTYGCIVAN